MAVYGNIMNETGEVVQENYLINEGFFEEMDNWKTSNQNHSIQKFKSTTLSDDDYDMVRALIRQIKESDTYKKYKEAFDKFCAFIKIVPDGVIFKKYELKQGKEGGKHSLEVEYSSNTRKIKLPEGAILYHMSTNSDIKELIPQFRGKAVKGFIYDKPRVYFTIRKKMPRFLADYKLREKLYTYVCMEDIKEAYVDPLVWGHLYGAVYVETDKPIKVKLVTKEVEKELKERQAKMEKSEGYESTVTDDKEEKEVKESGEFNFDDFFTFVTENGFNVAEEDFE